jgi:threonine synthase
MNKIECTNCHRPYPDDGVPYCCPVCGGIYDFAELPMFNPNQIEPGLPGIWRYRFSFGLPPDAPIVSLGEGSTPLIPSVIDGREVFYKLEYLNPTGSFKDRGASLIASFLKARGVDTAVEDSSGNAGASFAAYAARSGIHAQIYVPSYASGPKCKQIEMYGAEIFRIPGPRSKAAQAVIEAARSGKVYASHAYLPFGMPGYATIAYELVEQLGCAPGAVFAPVGQGGLILGLSRGFDSMKRAGVIPDVPKLFGVQARACAPLWALSQYGQAGLNLVSEGETIAEGVRVLRPIWGDVVLRAVESSRGQFIAVEEDEILAGRDKLARQGFYVEPTSAIVWSALKQMEKNTPSPIVAILTGFGLKSGL